MITFENLFDYCSPEPNSGCWLWTRALDNHGYGRVWHDKRMYAAHRVVFGLWHGSIPVGLDLDHICRVRACVNPEHLRTTTRAENTMEKRSLSIARLNANKSRCAQSHEFSPSNTYYPKRGGRQCRTCKRERDANYYLRMVRP